MGAMRLDARLVNDGLVPSRARARDLILRGFVRVEGAICDKPARTIAPDARVELIDNAPQFVSRGAEKLIAALDHFGFDPAGCVALDLGASTGGFTQALLQRGARRVYAVDVGQSQLHDTLKSDPRVISLEKQDARALTPELVPEPVDAMVADVSFIALSKVLQPALPLTRPGAWLAALIKPQFELDPGSIGKGGIVRDEALRRRATEKVSAVLAATPGWRVLGIIPSPILGGSGNEEFLIGARRDG
jgi:23S rRNA (cytidine1920-2'-O)/16S rRNA (cytidine1409-2'-O)-methyltransferase